MITRDPEALPHVQERSGSRGRFLPARTPGLFEGAERVFGRASSGGGSRLRGKRAGRDRGLRRLGRPRRNGRRQTRTRPVPTYSGSRDRSSDGASTSPATASGRSTGEAEPHAGCERFSRSHNRVRTTAADGLGPGRVPCSPSGPVPSPPEAAPGLKPPTQTHWGARYTAPSIPRTDRNVLRGDPWPATGGCT